MPPQKNTSTKIIWTIIILVIIAVIAYFALRQNPSGATSTASSAAVASTSAPTIDETGWQTSINPATGISFKYPAQLPTAYIRAPGNGYWPPTVMATSGPFACAQSGSQNDPAGKTSEFSVNGDTYCVTVSGEGAAGSTYISYSYLFPHAHRFFTLAFTLQYPDCGNYPDPQMTACTAEETSFDVNALADAMAQTIAVN